MKFPRYIKYLYLMSSCLLILLHACASTRFSAGEQKNSLPLLDRDHIEEVHSVVVAPFYRDENNWRQSAQEILSTEKLSVIQAGKVDAAARKGGADLLATEPENRPATLVKLARSLQADAVLNGIILPKNEHREIILQLISSKDSRVLFWQAADFTVKEGPIDGTIQKEFLSKLLAPVLANAARRDKPSIAPVPTHAPKTESPKVEMRQETETPKDEHQPKAEKKPKADRRHDKGRRPAPATEDISPM